MQRFTSIYIHTSHFSSLTEITLQDIPIRKYTLRLFVADVESELRKKDNYTWTPAQRLYVPCFLNTYTHWWMCVYRGVSPTSQIHAEVRMKSGRWVWAKYQEAKEAIDLDRLFNAYWSSNDRKLTALGQSLSPIGVRRSN